MRNRTGPRMDPCGNPVVILSLFDKTSAIRSHCSMVYSIQTSVHSRVEVFRNFHKVFVCFISLSFQKLCKITPKLEEFMDIFKFWRRCWVLTHKLWYLFTISCFVVCLKLKTNRFKNSFKMNDWLTCFREINNPPPPNPSLSKYSSIINFVCFYS